LFEAADLALFVSSEDIPLECKPFHAAVEAVLDRLSVQLGADSAAYRIEGGFMHMPPVLLMLTNK
jgi:hypothetical protein